LWRVNQKVKIKISKVRKVFPAEWDAIWQNCSYATYFHSREWAEICDAYFRGRSRSESKMVVFSDNKKAIIILTCLKENSSAESETYISSSAGTYGGWISAEGLGQEHGRLLVEYLLKECGNIYWRVNPYDPLVYESGICPAGEVTHMLDLSEGFDSVLKKFSRGNISSIHKAQKNNVKTRAALTMPDWQEYFSIYQDSLLRWGEKASSRYGCELFKEMYRRQSDFIRLWVAVLEDKIISGALCFYAKNHVVYWHGATLKEYFSYRPANILFFEVIRKACAENYSWFDFNPSGGHEGVVAFKNSFGAKTLFCPVVCANPRKPSWMERVSVFLRAKIAL
jgi:hypothetical protein